MFFRVNGSVRWTEVRSEKYVLEGRMADFGKYIFLALPQAKQIAWIFLACSKCSEQKISCKVKSVLKQWYLRYKIIYHLAFRRCYITYLFDWKFSLRSYTLKVRVEVMLYLCLSVFLSYLLSYLCLQIYHCNCFTLFC